jgi:ABC-2 type transport system ATP-binding protein
LNASIPAIRATNLSKRYRRVWALDRCDLSIPQSSFTALVGANGAGKSTFLTMLVGLLKPTAGDIEIFGLSPSTQRRLIMANVGFVAQDRPLYRSLSVADTLEMGRRLNDHWDRNLATDRLVRLRIPLGEQVGRLSGGQQAQVSLSLALGKRPSLLILDEPMASLDPLARQSFLDEVSGVAKNHGMTVMLSSHIISELARVCDYVVILDSGKVKAAGPVDALVATWAATSTTQRRAGMTDLEHSVLAYLGDGVQAQ